MGVDLGVHHRVLTGAEVMAARRLHLAVLARTGTRETVAADHHRSHDFPARFFSCIDDPPAAREEVVFDTHFSDLFRATLEKHGRGLIVRVEQGVVPQDEFLRAVRGVRQLVVGHALLVLFVEFDALRTVVVFEDAAAVQFYPVAVDERAGLHAQSVGRVATEAFLHRVFARFFAAADAHV